jgi:hypothetical protein
LFTAPETADKAISRIATLLTNNRSEAPTRLRNPPPTTKPAAAPMPKALSGCSLIDFSRARKRAPSVSPSAMFFISDCFATAVI